MNIDILTVTMIGFDESDTQNYYHNIFIGTEKPCMAWYRLQWSSIMYPILITNCVATTEYGLSDDWGEHVRENASACILLGFRN